MRDRSFLPLAFVLAAAPLACGTAEDPSSAGPDSQGSADAAAGAPTTSGTGATGTTGTSAVGTSAGDASLAPEGGAASEPADGGAADASVTGDGATADGGCAFAGDYESAAGKNPPGGCFPWYPSSIFKTQLPAHPVIDANSAMYNRIQGHNNADSVPQLGTFGPGNASEPVYYTHGSGVPMKVSCGANGIPWGVSSCASSGNKDGTGRAVNLNGTTLNMPPEFVIEVDDDHHMSRIDTVAGDDFVSWADVQPTSYDAGATFGVGSGGLCDLSGDGTGCSGATATDLPYSLGLVRAEDILACLDSGDPHCTMPYALAIASICNSARYIYPATASDGQCGNFAGGAPADDQRPIEGGRAFLALTDDEVNALSVPEYEKVYLRTIDQEHFGFVDTDSGWDMGSGFGTQSQGNAPYDTYKVTNPWTTLAKRFAIERQGDGSYSFPLPTTGIDLVNQIKWCAPTSSGRCDGVGTGPQGG